MTDADMQEYYDNFFEEVFVETNDKVAISHSSCSHAQWRETLRIGQMLYRLIDADLNGYYNNVQNCFHWTYSDSYYDADGYYTQFDTNIGTNKVVF